MAYTKNWIIIKIYCACVCVCVCVCLCVCVYYWPPVRGFFPNYEAVEFQPWKVTPPKPSLC